MSDKTMKAPDVKDLQALLDLQAQHFLQIDESLASLKDELREIKSAVSADKDDISGTRRFEDRDTFKKEFTIKEDDPAWYASIDLNRYYTQKEIVDITKISQPTLSMAKIRGHVIIKGSPGQRRWWVLGSELIAWDRSRAKIEERIRAKKEKESADGAVKSPKAQAKRSPSAKKAAKPPVKAVKKASEPQKDTVDLTSQSSSNQVKKPAPVSSQTKKTAVVSKNEKTALVVQAPVKAGKKPVAAKPSTPAADVKAPAKAGKKPVGAKPATPAAGVKAVKKSVAAKPSTPTAGVKAPAKAVKKAPATQPRGEIQIPIPKNMPDRIEALTSKKVITQTELGQEVDLPQKVIYEISTRKMKTAQEQVVQKIDSLLKKYESR
ncbi:MAG TPA: hypothetical protein VN372_14015 [Methanospirillum sp.]|nr:hypothetical protein [Methanospirillum sp.]